MDKLYTEREMFDEIKEYVESLGGVLHELDMGRHVIDMEIDPDLEEQVILFLEDLISEYGRKRNELRQSNPFYGVIDMIDNLKEDE